MSAPPRATGHLPQEPPRATGKELACNAGDLGSVPGLGRSPGEGKGYPLQYSGLESSTLSNSRGQRGSLPQTRRGLTLLSQLCRDPAVGCIRWPKYWSFSFNISPSNEDSGLISFRIDWLDLLAVQGTLRSLLRHHSSKASILWPSGTPLPHPCSSPM